MIGPKKIILPFIALQIISTVSFAALDSKGTLNVDQDQTVSSPLTQTLSNSSSFNVKGNLVVNVLKTDDARFKKLEGGKLSIGAGSDITVLEARIDEQLGEVVHIGINNDEDANGISDLWVRSQDLNVNALERENDSDFGSEIQQSEKIWMDDVAGSTAKKKKMTYCYRFVKEYLMKTGQVPVYLPGGSAYMAANVLPKYGFKRLGIKPSQASVGDVCVYRGGKGGNGHIEVLTAKGWYYGYGYIDHPIANHPFIACFRK